MNQLLNKFGFNSTICGLLKSKNIFLVEKQGTTRHYFFRQKPLCKGKMEEILTLYRKPNPPTEEESAIQLLKSKGYSLKVCKGFDVTRFAKEHPDLYSQYLIYEEVI